MDLRYPIGKPQIPDDIPHSLRTQWLAQLEALPSEMAKSVAGLKADQLDTPYRDGGWTLRQVVHHTADSHLHAYTRCKFALLELNPVILPYDESAWAALPDAATLPVEVSLSLLDALHTRWAAFFRALDTPDWNKAYIHPEREKPQTLLATLGLYAWHGRHHTAHITGLRDRMGW